MDKHNRDHKKNQDEKKPVNKNPQHNPEEKSAVKSKRDN